MDRGIIQQNIRYYKEQKLLFECKAKEAVQVGLFDTALLHLVERKELVAKIDALEILLTEAKEIVNHD